MRRESIQTTDRVLNMPSDFSRVRFSFCLSLAQLALMAKTRLIPLSGPAFPSALFQVITNGFAIASPGIVCNQSRFGSMMELKLDRLE